MGLSENGVLYTPKIAVIIGNISNNPLKFLDTHINIKNCYIPVCELKKPFVAICDACDVYSCMCIYIYIMIIYTYIFTMIYIYVYTIIYSYNYIECQVRINQPINPMLALIIYNNIYIYIYIYIHILV